MRCLWIVSWGIAAALHAVLAAERQVPPAGRTPAQVFTGNPIDVDYQGALLRVVLRQLADIGGINLVIDPGVPANTVVDLKLIQVPWDQVMDVVLKSAQLTYVI